MLFHYVTTFIIAMGFEIMIMTLIFLYSSYVRRLLTTIVTRLGYIIIYYECNLGIKNHKSFMILNFFVFLAGGCTIKHYGFLMCGKWKNFEVSCSFILTVTKALAVANALAYYSIWTLRINNVFIVRDEGHFRVQKFIVKLFNLFLNIWYKKNKNNFLRDFDILILKSFKNLILTIY